jgi:hypothetical protein
MCGISPWSWPGATCSCQRCVVVGSVHHHTILSGAQLLYWIQLSSSVHLDYQVCDCGSVLISILSPCHDLIDIYYALLLNSECEFVVRYSTVQYSTLLYSTVQYSIENYSTVQYSTVQYRTVQYSAFLSIREGEHMTQHLVSSTDTTTDPSNVLYCNVL